MVFEFPALSDSCAIVDSNGWILLDNVNSLEILIAHNVRVGQHKLSKHMCSSGGRIKKDYQYMKYN